MRVLNVVLGFFLAVAMVACDGGSAPAGSTWPTAKLTVEGGGRTMTLQVELANTESRREQGLMYRQSLDDGHGMLFLFPGEVDVGFWMQNTYIPLDMLFIRADGRIQRIVENAEPLSTKLIPSGGPVRAVLEVIGGTARKLGIAPGDRVASPIFNAH